MIRKAIFFLSVSLLFALCGCFPQDKPPEKDLEEYPFEYVAALDFENLDRLVVSIPYIIDENSSSFELKEVTRSEDRRMIGEFIAGLSLTETEDSGGEGFDLLIEIGGDEEIYLVFAGDIILINNSRFYTADEDMGEKARDLYDGLDYDARKLE